MSEDKEHIAIVGAGAIGLCSAYYLAKAGNRVTVCDRSPSTSTQACSFGNAGYIVPSHFTPLASPGVVKNGLRWMLKSKSPFHIKPRLEADLIRWLRIFWKNATPEHVKKSAPVLYDMQEKSLALFKELSTETGFTLNACGLRSLYKTKQVEQHEIETAKVARDLGIEAQILAKEEIEAQEPGMRYDIIGGSFYPGDAIIDPREFMGALRTKLTAMGVTFVSDFKVQKLVAGKNRIEAVRSVKGDIEADAFVVAGGSWSAELLKTVGIRLLLQAGKGVNVTINEPFPNLKIPSVLCEARLAVSPFPTGLRIGGTLDLAGLDLRIHPARIAAIMEAIPHYMPQYPIQKLDGVKPWAGLRPCSPDGMPYIDRTLEFSNLIVATGHAMKGLSMAPITGQAVQCIISTVAAPIPLEPFRLDRF